MLIISCYTNFKIPRSIKFEQFQIDEVLCIKKHYKHKKKDKKLFKYDVTI